jgi:hypothetical protein
VQAYLEGCAAQSGQKGVIRRKGKTDVHVVSDLDNFIDSGRHGGVGKPLGAKPDRLKQSLETSNDHIC